MAIILLAESAAALGCRLTSGGSTFRCWPAASRDVAVMTLVYATEFFMAFYRGGAAEREVFIWRISGPYAPIFWGSWRATVLSRSPVSGRACAATCRDHFHRRASHRRMWFERFMFV